MRGIGQGSTWRPGRPHAKTSLSRYTHSSLFSVRVKIFFLPVIYPLPQLQLSLSTASLPALKLLPYPFPTLHERAHSPFLSPLLIFAPFLTRPPTTSAAPLLRIRLLMSLPDGGTLCIREVWAHNLQEEFELIRKIVDDYPYVAVDTEFPGVIVRPVGVFKSSSEYHYQALRANVNVMKLIQLGFTFTDENGRLPHCGNGEYCVWQFNFREFNVRDDIYAPNSIELLTQSGIDFAKNQERGIDAHNFGELLMSSGIVLNQDVHYVSFHGAYDFAYLLKILTCTNLPFLEADFFDLLNIYFGTFYDVKYMMQFCNDLHGGLDKLSEILQVKRFGASHQAGSDSLLTSSVFQKLKDGYFDRSTEKFSGVLYGLGIHNAIVY